MNPMRLVSLNLPVELIAAIGRAARDAGQTPQDLVRATLQQVFLGNAAPTAEPSQPAAWDAAQPPVPVQRAFADALGWLDLQSRLRATGFVLRLGADRVLALHTWPADHRLIDSAAIGQPLAELTLRFRAPFPGQVQAEGGEGHVPAPPRRKGRAA
ncbi:hypothetical protein [Frigidibacter mobilis]|uniref:Ribbon-helix-helix protein, copG family n=1 Tax=Frigidibacter mobilis TaxID=1335048 RepID=A0A159ZAB9_9RHOB|nr:hypothetical protein [Frigidibacter mobilis]AMY71888.1 hypothetical protein AKL17_4678 [Frigidibacter mobilis]